MCMPLFIPLSTLAAEFSGAASIQAALAPTSSGYPTPRVKGNARVQKSLSDEATVHHTHPTILADSDGLADGSSRRFPLCVLHICVAVQLQALKNEGGRLAYIFNDVQK